MDEGIKLGDKVEFRGKVWIVVLEGINEMLIANHEDVDADGYIDYWVDIRYLKLIGVVASETELCKCEQPKWCSVNEIDRNRCKNCKRPLWHN